jgi:hypothetical protein
MVGDYGRVWKRLPTDEPFVLSLSEIAEWLIGVSLADSLSKEMPNIKIERRTHVLKGNG